MNEGADRARADAAAPEVAHEEPAAALRSPDGLGAVVLAGGRSSRLGGVPKPQLRMEGPSVPARGGESAPGRGAETDPVGGMTSRAEADQSEGTAGHGEAAPPGGTTLPAGTTLLGATLAALLDAGVGAGRIVVVGPADVLAGSGYEARGIRIVRENPPFAGPVAGIAVGVEALAADAAPAGLVLTLACDMPGVGAGIRALMDAADAGGERSLRAVGRSLRAVGGHGTPLQGPGRSTRDGDQPARDGGRSSDVGARSSTAGVRSSTGGAATHPHPPDAWVGISRGAADDGGDQVQHLLALHRLPPLRAALRARDTAGMSVRRLLSGLEVVHVELPAGSADDVDTWDDAQRLGLRAPAGHRISAELEDAAGEPAREDRR